MAYKDSNSIEIVALDNQIKDLQAKRAKLLLAPEMTVTQKLAVYLHQKLCRWNHTDGCGWYYAISDGKHNWDEHTHNLYLNKASKLLFCISRYRTAGYKLGDENILYSIIDIIAD